MRKKLLVVLSLLMVFAAVAAPKAKAAKAKGLEPNRLELINPMKPGQFFLRANFNSCSFYYGTDKLENPAVEFRKAGGKWKKALTPVHFYEDKHTTTNLVMNEYRGSIVKLEENTVYEVRFLDGGKVLAQGKVTTWKSDVPVAKTIYIDADNFKAPYLISAKGTPEGWIRYTVKGGKTLRVPEGKLAFDVKNAKYVLLDDMTIVGGKNSRSVIDMKNSQGVRVRNCDISGWGRIGTVKFDTPKARGVYYLQNAKGRYYAINYDGAIYINPGNKEIVVERCYIHDPVSRANSWYYTHPAGPQAIVCTKPDHSVVIRYNDFIGSDLHRWNDAFEGPGNFHSNGGINRDSDVYGNYMIFANDDCIELDGGQQNVRCFWNHFESALCGVSIQGCMTSPVYVFENIFGGICGEFNERNASIKNSGGNGVQPVSFIFNNTFAGNGSAMRFNDQLESIVKNNVMVDTQTLSGFERLNKSSASSNSAVVTVGNNSGVDKFDTKLVNHKHGNFVPVEAQKAEYIDNFCEGDSVRGALQKNSTEPLPYRPFPVVLDRTRIEGVVVKNGTAEPNEIKITAVVGGKNFKSAYSIRKNNVFDWMDITPSKGVLKSGDKITFTVKFNPEKMNKAQFYRGAFLLRLANGFSRVVAVYAETDFHQPYKLEKAGEKAIYIDAFKPAKVTAKKGKAVLKVINDKLGVNGKVAVTDQNKVFEYKVDVPESGRYYIMVRGYSPNGRSPKLKVSVNGSKSKISVQQCVKDRMRWTMLAPGYSLGFKAEYFDLEAGETTFSIQGAGHPLYFDGFVLVSNPESFEPR